MEAREYKPTWDDLVSQPMPRNQHAYSRKPRRPGDRDAHWGQESRQIPSKVGKANLSHELVHAPVQSTVHDPRDRKASSPGFFGDLLVRLADLLTEKRVTELSGTLARAHQNQQPLLDTHKALAELAQLERDWDSYGGIPPTAEAISAGYGVVLHLWSDLAETASEGLAPWTTAPLHNGGVQFEWNGTRGIVEVEIGPDGKVSFLVEQDDETIRESEPGVNAEIPVVVGAIRDILGY